MMETAANRPVADVLIADLLIIEVPAVIGYPFYYIFRWVFAFLLIKIVFLIVKLVTYR